MRVVSGKARGIKLRPVPGDTTRPILDRVKTALFDILRPSIQDKTILDLFAGSGSVGIEALSQGSRECTFLDINEKAVNTIKSNLQACNLIQYAHVKNTDAFRFLRTTKQSFDLIYIAPPQYKSIWLEALQTISERPHLLNIDAQVIVQIDPREYESFNSSLLREANQRKYGNSLLVFYAT
jgi:16S rRNA (guanine966-N2)-methyltransferase